MCLNIASNSSTSVVGMLFFSTCTKRLTEIGDKPIHIRNTGRDNKCMGLKLRDAHPNRTLGKEVNGKVFRTTLCFSESLYESKLWT